MRLLRLHWLPTLIVAFYFFPAITACSSDIPDSENGRACASDADCSNMERGFCHEGGVCSQICYNHDDCGCPPTTKSDDIANGACGGACVTVAGGRTICLKVCDDDDGCGGTTTCTNADVFRVCS